jgi:hypothetical protein
MTARPRPEPATNGFAQVEQELVDPCDKCSIEAECRYKSDPNYKCSSYAQRPATDEAVKEARLVDLTRANQLLAENQRLEAEHDRLLAVLKDSGLVWTAMLRGQIARPRALDHYEECKARVCESEVELSTLRAERDRLREALGTFVALYNDDHGMDHFSDNTQVEIKSTTLGVIRKARDVLVAAKEDARECDAYPAACERCEGHICTPAPVADERAQDAMDLALMAEAYLANCQWAPMDLAVEIERLFAARLSASRPEPAKDVRELVDSIEQCLTGLCDIDEDFIGIRKERAAAIIERYVQSRPEPAKDGEGK